MLPTQFHSFGEAVLEEKLCVEIDQSETRLTGSYFFKSSPLKLLAQMNRNLVGGLYTQSSITIAHLVLIH
jgi:hypothetical protein